MTTQPLRVSIIGCGLIGRKRAEALGDEFLVGFYDIDPNASKALAEDFGTVSFQSLDELLAAGADVVVVATIHSELAALSIEALKSGSHVLVEKPAGIGTGQIDGVAKAAALANKLVKVGFNHRFHPGIHRAITEAKSGIYGEILFARGRYGHGGRPGYDREWRADPSLSGGGEIVDQGMHLLDLFYWLLGDLPVHSSLLRTQFWDAPVDDNAVIVLGESGGVGSKAPWAILHVSWTEWKNLFSLEIYCRDAKLAVEGLVRSYGPQKLNIYKMLPEMGPPDVEEVLYPLRDASWEREWAHFASAVRSHDSAKSEVSATDLDAPGDLLGDLESARFAWSCVEKAQSL